MQTCAQWLRQNCRDLPQCDDRKLDSCGLPPHPSVYRPLRKVRRLILHHSATGTGCARVFRALHRAVNGWVDVGYHYIIGNGTLSGDGQVEPGRPDWAVGAHARKNNEDSLGICLVGDLDSRHPTRAQRESLARLLRELMSRFGLSPENIILHRDAPGCRTRCPGRNFSMDTVRGLISGCRD